jgi:hypothetical protein
VAREVGSARVDLVDCDTTTALDRAPIGVPITYAVWTLQGGNLSAQPVRSRPVVAIADVVNLVGVAGDREVRLTWRRPPGVVFCTVTREPPFPDGERRVEGAELTDTGLRNDQSYTYTVTASFRDPASPEGYLVSAGVRSPITPYTGPVPVALVASEQKNGTWAIRGDQAAVFALRRSPSAHGIAPGTRLADGELHRLGGAVPGGEKNMFEVALHPDRWALVTALTRAPPGWVVGRSTWIGVVPPPFDAHAWRDGRAVRVTWAWPPEVGSMDVRWEAPDGPGTADRIDRREEHPNACLRFEPGDGLVRLELVSVAGGGGPSSRARVLYLYNGVPTRIAYALVAAPGFWPRARPPCLELRLDADVDLPALRAVAQPNRAPLEPTEGSVVRDWPARRFTGRVLTLDLPATFSPDQLLRLFCVDPADAARFVFVAAAGRRA